MLMSRMIATVVLTTMLVASVTPAWATVTLCDFSPYTADGYSIEFTGHGEIQTIESHDQSPRMLEWRYYAVLDFDRDAERIHLEHRNQWSPFRLPSFTLKGAGPSTWMTIGNRHVLGELNCDW